ncbi:MAG: ATP-binding cassette domain-containing protein [Acetatifactor sp.]|nr:ATP-binding cassette domain-containing protein [Acetatifactor sp.]
MENFEKKIIVKNLKISFRTQGGKVQAIRDISFDLNKGETLALVGESGSGKSVTNRAIIGILAGNAIVESGEIIYDGQDLLKVEEEEFHKIRGDRIAMIFQDPMSSLNPIMRVGKQLTEAMLLKGKASQKNARHDFNRRLAGLNKYMDLAQGEGSKEKNAQLCRTFDNFCILSTKMESAYNAAHEKIEEILSDIDDLLFLIEKKQQIDIKARVRGIENDSKDVYADFLVKKNSELPGLVTSLTQTVSAMNGKKVAVPEGSSIEKYLRKIKELLEETLQGETPNFFCLGYYCMKNPNADVTSTPVHELNKMVHDYLAENFMNEFIETAAKGVAKSFEIALRGRREAQD